MQNQPIKNKSSDNWYTPPHIVELVVQVLGKIDLDPCAEVGCRIPASTHYTCIDNGLTRTWHGRVFLNPPYSRPGKWITKLSEEITVGRVKSAIALVPASTDTGWLSPVLATQPVCFWKGRIKFLDTNYEPKLPARQSHCLVYWGSQNERFKEVFDAYGVVQLPRSVLMVKNSTVSTPVDNNASPETVLTVNNSTISTQGEELKAKSVLMVNNSTISTRRSRGEGTGRIQIRTITKKNGKQYQQAWYDWQMHNQAHTISKSTYIPKHLLEIVQQLEQQKAPVREILQVLGVQ
jgi:phage N-6-adenine-methyltransferase